MDRTALTAATFCVFLTLGTEALEGAFLAGVLRARGFGVAFLAFAAALALAPLRSFTGLRADAFAAEEARLALGLVDDFTLTARFAFFADGFALERDVDRLNPFVRLLLMCGSQKAAHLVASSRGIAGSLPQARP